MCNRAQQLKATYSEAQLKAKNLAEGLGLAKDEVHTLVAGMLTVSDATFGEKNFPSLMEVSASETNHKLPALNETRNCVHKTL